MQRKSKIGHAHSVSITEADICITRVQTMAQRMSQEMSKISPMLDKIFQPEPAVMPIEVADLPGRCREFCRKQLTPLATSHPRLGEILKEWWAERKTEKE